MLKIIKAFFTTAIITILGLAGGQGKTGGKAPRRFGIPALAMLSSVWAGFNKKDLALLLLLPILLIGYGVDSFLFNFLGQNEILTRLCKGFLLSLPFFVYGFKRWIISAIALVIAFQVQAGSLGHISWFGDILIEDICRYGVLGGLIAFNIFFRRKE